MSTFGTWQGREITPILQKRKQAQRGYVTWGGSQTLCLVLVPSTFHSGETGDPLPPIIMISMTSGRCEAKGRGDGESMEDLRQVQVCQGNFRQAKDLGAGTGEEKKFPCGQRPVEGLREFR